MWIRFIIYGALGWVVEIAWTGLGSALRHDPRLIGHTYLWMFLIYGLAAPIMEPVHNEIALLAWPVRGLIWVGLIFTIEFVTGWILDRITGECPWDYTGAPFSVCGYIRLDYAPAWFALGLLFEQVHLLLLHMTPIVSNFITRR